MGGALPYFLTVLHTRLDKAHPSLMHLTHSSHCIFIPFVIFTLIEHVPYQIYLSSTPNVLFDYLYMPKPQQHSLLFSINQISCNSISPPHTPVPHSIHSCDYRHTHFCYIKPHPLCCFHTSTALSIPIFPIKLIFF